MNINTLDRLSYIGEFGTGALSYEPIVDIKKEDQVLELDLKQ